MATLLAFAVRLLLLWNLLYHHVAESFQTRGVSSSQISAGSSSGQLSSTFLLSDKSQPQDSQQPLSVDKLSIEEAQKLKKRAQELRQEAKLMESNLRESMMDRSRLKQKELQDMISSLFATTSSSNTTITSTELVDRIESDLWTPEQLTMVISALYEESLQVSGAAAPPADFQIGNMRNSAVFQADVYLRLHQQIQALLDAAELLDEKHAKGNLPHHRRWTGRVNKTLKSNLKELQRANEIELQQQQKRAEALSTEDKRVQDYMKRSLGIVDTDSKGQQKAGSLNLTRVLENVALVPRWIPASLFPFLYRHNYKLSDQDVKKVEKEVLMGTEFYCTSTETTPQAALFRGNIRSLKGQVVVSLAERNNITDVMWSEVQERLQTVGLADRVQLFLWKDPEWKRPSYAEPEPKPIILAVPAAVKPQETPKKQGLSSNLLQGFAAFTSFLTTFVFGVSAFALNPKFFDAIVNQRDLAPLKSCLPIILGVIAIQVIHESAHRFTSRRHQIKVGWPVPLPSPQLGLFGCITPLWSFPPNRSALLDFAISGPLAGMLSSLLLM
jgi:hypothetical protein